MSHGEWIFAVIIGVVSVARTARFLIYDEFPPVEWLRARYLALFHDESAWRKLAECQYCVTPYLATGMFVWAWLSDTDTAWWVINGIWAGSYVAAVYVSYDQPD